MLRVGYVEIIHDMPELELHEEQCFVHCLRINLMHSH